MAYPATLCAQIFTRVRLTSHRPPPLLVNPIMNAGLFYRSARRPDMAIGLMFWPTAVRHDDCPQARDF